MTKTKSRLVCFSAGCRPVRLLASTQTAATDTKAITTARGWSLPKGLISQTATPKPTFTTLRVKPACPALRAKDEPAGISKVCFSPTTVTPTPAKTASLSPRPAKLATAVSRLTEPAVYVETKEPKTVHIYAIFSAFRSKGSAIAAKPAMRQTGGF